MLDKLIAAVISYFVLIVSLGFLTDPDAFFDLGAVVGGFFIKAILIPGIILGCILIGLFQIYGLTFKALAPRDPK